MNARRLSAILAALAALAGLWLAGQGLWIHAKAALAQHLLERAWRQTLDGAAQARPWPWADTWPVARLSAPEQGVDLIVLAGDSGRTLAFGPGHASGSALPGQPGLVLISGHRDTHFRFLRHVRPGDTLRMQTPSAEIRYRVEWTGVLDARRQRIADDGDVDRLVLVTCWPFDAIVPGGPLRYVVSARGEGSG
jgi:sortase A